MHAPFYRGFSEKVAVVTDGANQFGRAVALQLALQGCYVVVGFAAETDETNSALHELQSIGTLANAVAVDVSTDDGIKTLFETVAQTYGRLDLLVNANLSEPNSDFARIDARSFETAINRTMRAAFFCAQAGVELMRNRPNAGIVNLCGEIANNSLSAAIRSATIGLTESLAIELAPRVRVNCVTWKSEAQTENQNEFSLLRQPSAIAPDDAARTVLYLLSPEAAALNGQTLSVQPKPRKI